MTVTGKRPFPELAKRVEIDSQDQNIGGYVGVSGGYAYPLLNSAFLIDGLQVEMEIENLQLQPFREKGCLFQQKKEQDNQGTQSDSKITGCKNPFSTPEFRHRLPH